MAGIGARPPAGAWRRYRAPNRLYLRNLRAAHAGQALDIAGHHTAFDEAVATGDARTLLGQIRPAHRLKTGMLIRSTAEVSAILDGADETQLAAVCEYFEAVGIAYQITRPGRPGPAPMFAGHSPT
ncbi:polyprenyl synthetase family protein [Streptomyces sp. MK37H]|uniref:polyprenyl synthetase family protein n=1 Tax=Streptomyces sp. MK37H TaxID=2699117 RepID=UPI0027E420A9|nr:polyprenyl synthetase family protein [Streptomyces sp. MK37H]